MPWFPHGSSRIYFEQTGNGDPVLLLPGFSDTIGQHKPLRDRLSQHFRVIAADLPGSGRSDPQPRRYHPGYYEEDANSFIALLRELDAVPSHILGYSDGGEVGLLIAALAPQTARSVLTWGAAGAVEDPGHHITSAFRRVVDDPVPDMRGYRDYLVTTYGEDIARATTQSFADAIDAIAAAGGDISLSRAHQISCAVLLIFGQHDVFVPRAVADALCRRIAKGEVIEVEDAGHGVHEDRPEWFAKTVTDWLAKTG